MFNITSILRTSLSCFTLAILFGCATPTGTTGTPARDQTRVTDDTAPAAAEERQATTNAPAQDLRTEARRMIDSAAKLTFSSERTDLLKRVAARSDLTEADQIALIDAACEVGFSEHITAVMLTLARNPAFTAGGRTYMSEHVDCIVFSSQRKQVLDVLAGAAP